MCGIFGQVQDCAIDPAVIRSLAAENVHRGNLGFGYYAASLSGSEIDGNVKRFNQPYATHLLILDKSTHLFLGHIRAPTNGQRRLMEVHPFESADLLLAHNGILLNHGDFPEWRGKTTVDSETILNGIQAGLDAGSPTVAAIANVVSRLDGQQACWLWHKKEQCVYFWRVMSPIWLGRTATSITFSSTKTAECTESLPEGRILRLSPLTIAWELAGLFDFDTPYQIRDGD